MHVKYTSLVLYTLNYQNSSVKKNIGSKLLDKSDKYIKIFFL